MPAYRDTHGELRFGGVSLSRLIEAPEIATPSYVYDLDGMTETVRELHYAFAEVSHLVAYAVKANESGPILRALRGVGAGADVVSRGELELALECGFAPDSIVFSGVAKTDDEIRRAISIGPDGIRGLHIESIEELSRVSEIAASTGRHARVSLRINPGADPLALATHAHIATGHEGAKFGILEEDLPAALSAISASTSMELTGISTHIGSQLQTTDAYVRAGEALFRIAEALRGAGQGGRLRYVDTGGGFGIDYERGEKRPPGDFVKALLPAWRSSTLRDLAWMVEPGRALVGAHGVLIAKVIQTKSTRGTPWLFIDAGMNDLIRPALYSASHRIVALSSTPGEQLAPWHVAGPVCESSDDFGVHDLPSPPPSHVAILDAGAYGSSMSSRYNARMAPAELFLSGGSVVHSMPRGDYHDWLRRQRA